MKRHSSDPKVLPMDVAEKRHARRQAERRREERIARAAEAQRRLSKSHFFPAQD